MLAALTAHTAVYWSLTLLPRRPRYATLVFAVALALGFLANGLLPVLTLLPLCLLAPWQSAEHWRAARWLLEPVDYLSMRFTGVAAASPVSMTGTWLIDTRDLTKLAYDPVLVELAGGGADKLPPLQRFGSVMGTTSLISSTLRSPPVP